MPHEPERANALVQTCALRTQQTCSRGHIPIRLVECFADSLPFSVGSYLLQTSAAGLAGLPHLERNRFGRDARPRTENGHALHEIAQFANVAGPAVARQNGNHLRSDLFRTEVVSR